LQLIAAIRSHPRMANVPVLIVSSHGTEEDRQRGMDAGADAYIVKTAFDEAGLLTAVSRLLGRTGSPTPATRNGARGRTPNRSAERGGAASTEALTDPSRTSRT
jgi:DNA-binding response OmpR family regulator